MSVTWVENPIVADVDGDYHSEIVVPLDAANMSCAPVDPVFAGLHCGEDAHCPEGSACSDGLCRCESDDDCGDRHGCRDGVCRAVSVQPRAGIEVLRDALDRWVPSRPIWNQHAYSVTNVNDDGTIPSSVRPNWRQPGLNNFRQNARTEGGGAIDSPDLTVSELGAPACDASASTQTLSAAVCNRGSLPVSPGVDVAFHTDSPTGQVVCSATTAQPLGPGECEVVECVWSGILIDHAYEVHALVDDDESGIAECHEDNNAATVSLRCPPGLM
jgi:hypothetical protein